MKDLKFTGIGLFISYFGILLTGFLFKFLYGKPLGDGLTILRESIIFILVGILGIVLVPFLIKFIPSITHHLEKRDEKKSFFQALHIVQSDSKLSLALLFSGLMMMGHFLIIPFINPYMEFNNGYTKQQTPMIYLVGGIASFFAANWLGRISDKYGKLNVVCHWLLVLHIFHVFRIG